MPLVHNPGQMAAPPKQTTYQQAMVGVQHTPNGGPVLLIFQTPGEAHVFPMERDAARQLAGQLTGGLAIASEIPHAG